MSLIFAVYMEGRIMQVPETAYVREEQRFTQPWFWILVILGAGFMIINFAMGMVQQLIQGRPWGTDPMSNTMLWIMGPFFIIFGILLLLLFFSIRLVVEVRPSGLYLRFYPFHRRFHRIPLEKAVGIESVTYRPVLDYGGWGIRYTAKGKAYNVSGKRGVRIDMEGGTHILIGSQDPEKIVQAVGGMVKRGS